MVLKTKKSKIKKTNGGVKKEDDMERFLSPSRPQEAEEKGVRGSAVPRTPGWGFGKGTAGLGNAQQTSNTGREGYRKK